MLERLKARLWPPPPCEHNYQYQTIELWFHGKLTWYWCSKCGASMPRGDFKYEES